MFSIRGRQTRVAVPSGGDETNPQRGDLGYCTMDGGGSDGSRNPHSDRDTPVTMGGQPSHASHSKDSVMLQHAIQHQDAIGCDNFFEGRIAKDWEQAQDAYYKWCRSRKSARRWSTALIQQLWNVAWDLWEQRNGIIHDAENAEILNNMAEIDNEIRAQFQQGHDGLQQRDHSLFTGPVNGILTASIVYRQRWLQRVQTARARALRRQDEIIAEKGRFFSHGCRAEFRVGTEDET